MPRQKLYGQEESVALSIRLPASLKDTIQQRAAKNRRSLNQEIVWLIQLAVDQEAKCVEISTDGAVSPVS